MLLKSYSLFFAFCLCLDMSAITIDLKSAIEWNTALGHAYQLESTENGFDWTSVGSEQSGNNEKHSYILSSFSHGKQYRVRETIPGNAVPNTTVPNSGFELEVYRVGLNTEPSTESFNYFKKWFLFHLPLCE